MSVTITLSVGEAKWLAGVESGSAAGVAVAGRCAAVLAAHQREEKRKVLHLPWAPSMDRTPTIAPAVVVTDSADGYIWTPNEEVARLMAAAPDLANVLEDVLMFLESDCKELPCHPEMKLIRCALKKAGW